MFSLVWFGYFASGIIALSMTMNSIVRFRWVNLVGASCFCTYGFLLGAIPVGLLNGLIVCIDIYYLWNIYTKKDVFEILEIKSGSDYLLRFLEYHKNEIRKIHPDFSYDPTMNSLSYFILRNMQIAGLFLARKEGNDTLVIGLDYVIPEYRDFKNGQYIYNRLIPDLEKAGIIKIKAEATTSYNEAYFKKIGFRKDENGLFTLHLPQNSI